MGRPRGQKFPCAVGVRLTLTDGEKLAKLEKVLGCSPSGCMRLLLRAADVEGFSEALVPVQAVYRERELVEG